MERDEEIRFHVNVEPRTSIEEAEKSLRRERKFTEMALALTGSLVVVLDPEGRILRFNPACEAATGYTQAEIAGRIYWEFLVPESERDLVRRSLDMLLGDERAIHLENHLVAKDGRQILISWSNAALFDESGAVRYFMKTGIDTTARQQMEQVQERELHRLVQLSGPVAASVTAASLGQRKLSEAQPAVFTELVEDLAKLMEQALERQAFKVELPVSKGLQKISDALGRHMAAPRDATEVFLAALSQARAGNPGKSQAYLDEGRLLLLELMGKLVQYYRTRCLGVIPFADPSQAGDKASQ